MNSCEWVCVCVQMCVCVYIRVYIYICIATDGGDRTLNNYDCQNLQQIFTGVPVQIKHVFTGALTISNEFPRE